MEEINILVSALKSYVRRVFTMQVLTRLC